MDRNIDGERQMDRKMNLDRRTGVWIQVAIKAKLYSLLACLLHKVIRLALNGQVEQRIPAPGPMF